MDGFPKACVSSDRVVHFVIVIMMGGRVNIPARGSVLAGKGAFVLRFGDNNLSDKCSHKSGVKVKDTKYLVIGGELRIGARRLKKVNSYFCLGKKATREAERELAVTSRKDSSEVILEGANGTFG